VTPRFRPSAFRPARWLRGPHAQTIAGRFLRRAAAPPVRRERVATPDGDFLDLDFMPAAGRPPDAPVALVLHGLEGCTESGYVRTTLLELARQGIRGVGLNFRSCSGEPNRTARFYHAGETADLAHVVALLRERFPGAPIGVVGFSLGGNVLLKFLGERGREGPEEVRGAVAISVPYELAAGAERLERGLMSRVYTSYFMRRLLAKTAVKEPLLRETCDLSRVRSARTLREFDEAATAPIHGFRDASHYYRSSSAARFLHRIRVPTLLLQALDDPFLPAGSLPRAEIGANPFLVDGFTGAGGHVGFVSGPPWRPSFWAEREAARFLAGLLRPGA
jgi:uncharacterized protein